MCMKVVGIKWVNGGGGVMNFFVTHLDVGKISGDTGGGGRKIFVDSSENVPDAAPTPTPTRE